MSDPRVFFAAERTLLAWVRTGLTVMGLGFVVARFGLFLKYLETQHASSHVRIRFVAPSNLIGITLVLVGIVVVLAAAFQHRSFLKGLSPQHFPHFYRPSVAFFCALALGIMGLLVAILLAMGSAA
jgi:putative membrane protein